jgi:rhamnulokinase
VLVVAPACHDSAAAVIAVPTDRPDYLFLSSGTWSVLGTEIEEPHISTSRPPRALWNEAGAHENTRFTCNVTGLWLVQECRRHWVSQGERFSYDELTEMASAGDPLVSLVDPNDPRFLAPGDIPHRIRDYCRETGQYIPESNAAVLRCIFDSLALKYRQGREDIEAALGRRMSIVHVIGGGVRNRLLSQLTADAMQLPLVAGPVEATALGNVIMQAMATGRIASVGEAREMVRHSFPLDRYEPSAAAAPAWEQAYSRFKSYQDTRDG